MAASVPHSQDVTGGRDYESDQRFSTERAPMLAAVPTRSHDGVAVDRRQLILD
jgi:hypothetical protein